MQLRRVGLVADALLEFHLRDVEPPDHHEASAEDLVSLGVGHVELERFRERLDRLTDLLLCELAVPQRVPRAGRLRMIRDVLRQRRLYVLKLTFANGLFVLIQG